MNESTTLLIFVIWVLALINFISCISTPPGE
jgi:hypothetical protein